MLSGVLKKLGYGVNDDSKKSEPKKQGNSIGQGIGNNRSIGHAPSKLIPNADELKIISPPTIAEKTTEQSISIKPKFDQVIIDTNSIDREMTITPSTPFEEDLATIFSEGENNIIINNILEYLKTNQNNKESRVWFMLMDLYQITEDKSGFDKTALYFAQLFDTSPPSWFGKAPSEKTELMSSGKSMIILEPVLKPDFGLKFRDLLLTAKKEKFCRINVSQCKFEQNPTIVLEKLLKLFIDLRKANVVAILMGDNNLLDFCKKYINYQENTKGLIPAFIEQEKLLWLLYLEVLQWKGSENEFESLAFEFAEKFDISAPGWESDGVMEVTSLYKDNDVNSLKLDKNLNTNNINSLLDFITSSFNSGINAEIDFSNIERVDFSAAGSISFHIQELWSNQNHNNKKVIFKYPNELIVVLFHMVGVTEFVKVIPRHRK